MKKKILILTLAFCMIGCGKKDPDHDINSFEFADKTDYYVLNVATDANSTYTYIVETGGILSQIECNETGDRQVLFME